MKLRFVFCSYGFYYVRNSYTNFLLGSLVKKSSGRWVWHQDCDAEMWEDCLQEVVNKIRELENEEKRS